MKTACDSAQIFKRRTRQDKTIRASNDDSNVLIKIHLNKTLKNNFTERLV